SDQRLVREVCSRCEAEHGMRTGDWPIRFHIGAYVDFWVARRHYELRRSCGRNQAAPPTRSAGSSHRATLASSEAVPCPSAWRSSWLRSNIQCHPGWPTTAERTSTPSDGPSARSTSQRNAAKASARLATSLSATPRLKNRTDMKV